MLLVLKQVVSTQISFSFPPFSLPFFSNCVFGTTCWFSENLEALCSMGQRWIDEMLEADLNGGLLNKLFFRFGNLRDKAFGLGGGLPSLSAILVLLFSFVSPHSDSALITGLTHHISHTPVEIQTHTPGNPNLTHIHTHMYTRSNHNASVGGGSNMLIIKAKQGDGFGCYPSTTLRYTHTRH